MPTILPQPPFSNTIFAGIKKRNHQIATFQSEKITAAILKAGLQQENSTLRKQGG